MFEVVLGIGVVLILIILFALFRVQRLLSVAQDTDKGPGSGSNRRQALYGMVFLIGGIVLFFWYSFKAFDTYQLPIASEHGMVTDKLFWVTMAITGVVFILTHILLFGFAYKYQFNKNRKSKFYPTNDRLELLWTLVPAVVLAVLIFSGWKAWTEITGAAPEDSEEIEVFGYQFGWAVRYPGQDKKLGDFDYQMIDSDNEVGMDFSDRNAFDDFFNRELVVPKDKPVLLRIRARDVIHSVYAPHFRLQMNAVPGLPTKFWFIPNKTTEEMRSETGNNDFDYELVCNKICGRGHNAMRYVIKVVEQDEYEEWYKEQDPWLSKNPDYLSKVPENMRELAATVSGLKED